MDAEKLKAAAKALVEAVDLAKIEGYENAECVLTSEIRSLLIRIDRGEVSSPVNLMYTAGPRWNFYETRLGECKCLEFAWSSFVILVTGVDTSWAAERAKTILGL